MNIKGTRFLSPSLSPPLNIYIYICRYAKGLLFLISRSGMYRSIDRFRHEKALERRWVDSLEQRAGEGLPDQCLL